MDIGLAVHAAAALYELPRKNHIPNRQHEREPQNDAGSCLQRSEFGAHKGEEVGEGTKSDGEGPVVGVGLGLCNGRCLLGEVAGGVHRVDLLRDGTGECFPTSVVITESAVDVIIGRVTACCRY